MSTPRDHEPDGVSWILDEADAEDLGVDLPDGEQPWQPQVRWFGENHRLDFSTVAAEARKWVYRLVRAALVAAFAWCGYKAQAVVGVPGHPGALALNSAKIYRVEVGGLAFIIAGVATLLIGPFVWSNDLPAEMAFGGASFSTKKDEKSSAAVEALERSQQALDDGLLKLETKLEVHDAKVARFGSLASRTIGDLDRRLSAVEEILRQLLP